MVKRRGKVECGRMDTDAWFDLVTLWVHALTWTFLNYSGSDWMPGMFQLVWCPQVLSRQEFWVHLY